MSSTCRACTIWRGGPAYKEQPVSFHDFPKSGDKRRLWLEFCGLDPETDSSRRLSLCSRHFEPVYLKKYGLFTRLNPGAVPTLHPPIFTDAYPSVEVEESLYTEECSSTPVSLYTEECSTEVEENYSPDYAEAHPSVEVAESCEVVLSECPDQTFSDTAEDSVNNCEQLVNEKEQRNWPETESPQRSFSSTRRVSKKPVSPKDKKIRQLNAKLRKLQFENYLLLAHNLSLQSSNKQLKRKMQLLRHVTLTEPF